jgi:hypothetical protein
MTFEKKFEALMLFKRTHGHCDVPYRFKANPSLGMWCSALRHAYRCFQQGKPSKRYSLTSDQINRLEDIGFTWSFQRQQYRKAQSDIDMTVKELNEFDSDNSDTESDDSDDEGVAGGSLALHYEDASMPNLGVVTNVTQV